MGGRRRAGRRLSARSLRALRKRICDRADYGVYCSITEAKMTKRALMKDLAAAAGVSIFQVSRALNQKPDVSPELRETVHRLAREMNYRNSAAAHRPAVALLVRYFGEFSSNLLNELIRQGQERNWRTVAVPADQLDFLNDRLFDGAISIAAGDFSRNWHERFGIPLVMLNSYGWLLDRVCAVFPDSNGESRLAMEHLISLGHSRIGRLRIVRDGASEKEVNRGYDEFLRVADEYGIRNRVRYCHAPDMETLELRLRELIAEGFTAFVGIFMAEITRIIEVIRSCGKRVPEDISLIAYEADGLTAHLVPPVTALAYDYRLLAERALGQLELEMKGGGALRSIVVPGRLIVRGSTALRKQ